MNKKVMLKMRTQAHQNKYRRGRGTRIHVRTPALLLGNKLWGGDADKSYLSNYRLAQIQW